MQETLGTEGYIEAYQEKLSQAFAEEHLELHMEIPEITRLQHNPKIFSKRFFAGSFTALLKNGEGRFWSFRRLFDTAPESQRRDLMRGAGRGAARNMNFWKRSIRKVFFAGSLLRGLYTLVRSHGNTCCSRRRIFFHFILC